jgi:hypothetical protein
MLLDVGFIILVEEATWLSPIMVVQKKRTRNFEFAWIFKN